MNKPLGRRTCLYTEVQLDAIVADMARQAAGLLTGRTRVGIVGILRRGAPLADSKRYADGVHYKRPQVLGAANIYANTKGVCVHR